MTIFMRIALAACIIGMIAACGQAFSQEASPTPVPAETSAPAASPAPPTRFWLEVDQADLASISQALNELPKRIADPLILKLSGQLQPAAQAKIVENKDAAAEKGKKGPKK